MAPGLLLPGGRDWVNVDAGASIRIRKSRDALKSLDKGQHRSAARIRERAARAEIVSMLDPSDQPAAPFARDGASLSVHIEDADTSFAIGWKGEYRIEGDT